MSYSSFFGASHVPFRRLLGPSSSSSLEEEWLEEAFLRSSQSPAMGEGLLRAGLSVQPSAFVLPRTSLPLPGLALWQWAHLLLVLLKQKYMRSDPIYEIRSNIWDQIQSMESGPICGVRVIPLSIIYNFPTEAAINGIRSNI